MALLVVVLAGCTGHGPAPAATTPATLPQSAPDPDERCGTTLGGTKVTLTAEDGLTLSAARYGTGSRGVVLVHQSGADLCGWADQVPDLVRAGLVVLAIDMRCHGYSDCPADDHGETLNRDYA